MKHCGAGCREPYALPLAVTGSEFYYQSPRVSTQMDTLFIVNKIVNDLL